MARRGGWRGLGRKRFRYVDAGGKIVDAEHLAVIRTLAIPPAKRIRRARHAHGGDGLGNTAAVAREPYVSPGVVDASVTGQTLADFRRNGLRAEPPDHRRARAPAPASFAVVTS